MNTRDLSWLAGMRFGYKKALVESGVSHRDADKKTERATEEARKELKKR